MLSNSSETTSNLLESLAKLTNLENGLSSEETQRRLTKDGQNVAWKSEKSFSIWHVVLEEATEPMMLLLLTVAILALIFSSLRDGLAILAAILLVFVVEISTEVKAKRNLSHLQSTHYIPNARVMRDGRLQVIPWEGVVRGDLLSIERGESVSADAVIVDVTGMVTVDESLLTGESLPISKTSCTTPQPKRGGENSSMLYASTTLSSGACTAVVVATGLNTRVFESSVKIKKPKTPIQLAMKTLARNLSILAFLTALAVTLLTRFKGNIAWPQAILAGLSLAFATIPEELPLLIKVLLALSSLRLSRHGILVKNLKAAESMGVVDVVISDKTGTLTHGKLEVEEVVGFSQIGSTLAAIPVKSTEQVNGPRILSNLASIWTLSKGVGVEKGNKLSLQAGRSTFDDALERFLEIDLDKKIYTRYGSQKNDAFERMLELCKRYPILLDVQEFNSETKMASTVRSDGRNKFSVVYGAPVNVIKACTMVQIDDDVTELVRHQTIINETLESCANRGRCIAFAIKHDEILQNLTLVAIVVFADPVRAHTIDTISQLADAGITTIMATGDAEITATNVARSTGIHHGPEVVVCEGSRANSINMNDFSETDVFYRCTPKDKFHIVERYQGLDQRVLFLGDGANDTQALRQADVGVAMAKGGHWTGLVKAENKQHVGSAVDAAGLVLFHQGEKDEESPTGTLSSLVMAIAYGRILYGNIRKAVTFYLACKLALASVFLLATIVDGVPPLRPLQVILLEAVMDLGAGGCFVMEPGENVMDSSPSKNLFDEVSKWSIFLGGLVLFMIVGGSWSWFYYNGPKEYCITMVFWSWLIAHVILGTSVRSRIPLRIHGFFSNGYFTLWWIGCLGLGLAVYWISSFRELLYMLPVELKWIGILFGLSVGLILIPCEIIKEVSWQRQRDSVRL